MTSPVNMVVFDWGGVLIEVTNSWQDACARASLPVRAAERVGAFYGKNGAGDRFQCGAIEWGPYCETVMALFEGAYSAAEILAIHDAMLVGEYEGVPELLAELHALPGVDTALLSNTNAAHYESRRRYPGVASIRHPHASHLLGFAKPDAAIYAAFERATGRHGEEILFFDDLAVNVDAARQAGWRAERIVPEPNPVAQIRRHLVAHGVLPSR